MTDLFLGGARSGKSRLAEQLALQYAEAENLELVYIASATADDNEMRSRINNHQARRDGRWRLVEEPLYLAETLKRECGKNRCVLVDCLTLWLSNCLLAQPPCFPREREKLLAVLPSLPGKLILVSNETGLGVVPMGQLSREFVDEAGWLHQRLASDCDRVVFTVAGLPQVLKGEKL